MKQYFRLVKFMLPHIWILALAAVCMILSSLFSGASFTMIIPLVDNIISGKPLVISHSEYVPTFVLDMVATINSLPRMELLYKMIAIFTIMWLLKNFFEFWQSFFMNDISQRVVRDVKNIIYKKLLTLSMDFYSRNPTPKLMSRITYDAAVIRDSIAAGFTDVIYQPIQLIIYTVLLLAAKFYFSVPWNIVLIICILMPMVIYPVRKIGKRLKSISRQSQEKMVDITTTLHETISGVRVVKAFSMEDYEAKKFESQNQQFYKLTMKSVKRMSIISPITEFVGVACIAVVCWIAGRGILSGQLSPGAFGLFLLSLMQLMKPMKRLTNVYAIIQQALAAGERIYEVLDTVPSVMECKDAKKLPIISRDVEFDHVYFRYEDKDTLKDVSLTVKAGEIVAFVGPSGAGKTTLVNLVPRFYDPERGSVKIDGVDIKDVSLKSLMGQIGIVTQETILFNDTVWSNICYGSQNHERQSIINAAKVANAHDFIMKMPQGYDTLIGERGFRLSGGEKQRLAIARAVYKNPPILILDEATSQLDTESEMLVQEAIDRMMRGRTVFVIAHRLSTIKHANIIYVLEHGKVVENGSHEDLVSKNGLYKRLYDMQFKDGMIR